MKVILSVPDEGYSNLLILSVPDEGYSNFLILSVPDEGYFDSKSKDWNNLHQVHSE
jgi:hypothetical protein